MCTPSEAAEVFCDPGTTAPGEDDVTTAEIKAAWWDEVPVGGELTRVPSVFAEAVRVLCEACLTTSHHASPWKRAKVVLLPKTNKKPGTTKQLRPIALIPAFGRGLGRVVARKLAGVALEAACSTPGSAEVSRGDQPPTCWRA